MAGSTTANVHSAKGNDWDVGAKVFIESETGEGFVLGKVVAAVRKGLVTIEYEWNGQRLRKCVSHDQLTSFGEDGSIPKLYHGWLRVMHGSKSGDFESLREIQVESVIDQYRQLMVERTSPKAVFITGYIACGKSSFLKKVGQWDGFVHVNGDSLREQLTGGTENAQTVVDLRGQTNPVNQDLCKARRIISEETIKARANLLADSLTIPAEAALKCLAAGHDVTVIFVEPGGIAETIQDGGHIYEGRDAVVMERNMHRRDLGKHFVNGIIPGGVERNFQEMLGVAHDLKKHNIPVHHVLSKEGLYTYQGTLVPMDLDIGRDDAEEVVSKLIHS